VSRRKLPVVTVAKSMRSNRRRLPLFRPLPEPLGCERPRLRTQKRTTDNSPRYRPLSTAGLRQPKSAFGDPNAHQA
jgi:hypothetical protein